MNFTFYIPFCTWIYKNGDSDDKTGIKFYNYVADHCKNYHIEALALKNITATFISKRSARNLCSPLASIW